MEYKAKTAQDVVAETGPIDTGSKQLAEEAGVTDAAYADYAEALKNYEARDDVETLAERRAREFGVSFEDASFRREVDSVDNTGLTSTDTVTNKQPNTVDEKSTKAEPKKQS